MKVFSSTTLLLLALLVASIYCVPPPNAVSAIEAEALEALMELRGSNHNAPRAAAPPVIQAPVTQGPARRVQERWPEGSNGGQRVPPSAKGSGLPGNRRAQAPDEFEQYVYFRSS